MKLHLVRIALLLLVGLCLPFMSLRAGLAPPDGEPLSLKSSQGQLRFVPWGTAAGLALLVGVCVTPASRRR